jgi:N-acylneuraminate cytidylyltransferase
VVLAAKGSLYIDEVVLATDDPEAARLGRSIGTTVFKRSAESATDEAPTEIVLKEVVAEHPAEMYVLLQATSPLTRSIEIDGAIELMTEGYDSVLSVVPQTRFIWTEESPTSWRPVNYEVTSRPRRQDTQATMIENGAIYVFRAALLEQTGARLGGRIGGYVMPLETYFEIDEITDWDVAEGLMRKRISREALPRYRDIRLVISDVDGVLTDNGMYWSSDGAELKKFSARDGKGFERLHNQGIKTVLLTSESADLVKRRGEKLGCYDVILGSRNKLVDAESVIHRLQLSWDNVAFLGDDVHDCELMQRAGLSAAPVDATPEARRSADLVLKMPGGEGAFREFAELILETLSAWG